MGMASISSAVGRRSGLGCNKHATMARKSSEYVLSIGLCSTHYTPVRTSDMKGHRRVHTGVWTTITVTIITEGLPARSS